MMNNQAQESQLNSQNLKQLPKGWVWTKLKEACKCLPTGVPAYDGSKEYYSTGSIQKDSQIPEGAFSFDGRPSRANRISKFGDVFQARMANTNKALLIGEKLNEKLFSTGFIQLRPFDSYVGMPSYLYYYVQSSTFLNQRDLFATGSTQVAITDGGIDKIYFPLAPLPEQNRIVAKIEELFSDLDEGTAALRRVQMGLKCYKRSMLRSMCGGVFVDRKLRMDKFGNDELSEGWKWTTIGEVIDSLDSMRIPVNKKERDKRQGQYPYYGANGQVDWIDGYIFDEPLVLVVEDETFTGREKPFSYKINGKTWVNNHAHVLRAKKDILDVDYLNYSLTYYPFTQMTTGTTGRKKLIKSVMMAAPYALPPLKEQKRIVAEIEKNLSAANETEKIVGASLAQSERLRQSILKKAFEGELVPQDPEDEPAEKMLERIRAQKSANSENNKRKSRS